MPKFTKIIGHSLKLQSKDGQSDVLIRNYSDKGEAKAAKQLYEKNNVKLLRNSGKKVVIVPIREQPKPKAPVIAD